MLDFSKNVTRSELADSLGVSRITLWRLERDGRIPAGTRVNPTRTEFTPAAQMVIADVLRQPVEA
jgi:DNA-binding XRE family transcriptional regulator